MDSINNALNIMEIQEESMQSDIFRNEESLSILGEGLDKEDKNGSSTPSSLTSYLKDATKSLC